MRCPFCGNNQWTCGVYMTKCTSCGLEMPNYMREYIEKAMEKHKQLKEQGGCDDKIR